MPKIITIYSENNDFQHLEVLKRNREKRTKFGEFFVEGVKPIELLIKNNWQILSFAYSKEGLSDWAKKILACSNAETHFELPLDLMHKLSDKEEISELIAIVKIPPDDLSRIKTKKELLIVVFDRASSPGNLGTIIRSCDSLGADGLIVTGHSVDVYDSKTIRASLGTLFSLTVIRLPSDKEVLQYIKNLEENIGTIQIVGSTIKTQTEIYNCDFKKPTVLLIGNETHGLSSNYKSMSSILVKIPMQGSASSLNVANATSIILYEIQRQRKGA
ncbi:MAG: TrmH family RNA methyltransferase [Candidatus Woesearchaeota archaeon]|jgi:TrmH family RNA methyltransferase